MGCWNKTCGISQFPIFYGQKTVTFVIIENERYGNVDTMPCYLNPYWDFIPLPIYGKYNDYGGQDDDAGQEYKYEILREFFKDQIVKIGEDNYFKGDSPFTDGKSLSESVNRGLFAIKSSGYGVKNGQKHRAISFMMINRDLFEQLTESVTVREYRYDKSKAQTFTKSELCSTVERYQKFESEPCEEDEYSRFMGSRMMKGVSFIKDNYDDNDYYSVNHGVIDYFTRNSSDSSIQSYFFNEFSQRLQPLDVVDSCLFMRTMSFLRKQIIPQSHEGSQGGIESIHQKYINALQSVVNNHNAEFEEDEEDETE